MSATTQLFFDSFNKIQVGLFVSNFGKKEQSISLHHTFLLLLFVVCTEIDGEIAVNMCFIFKGYLFFSVLVLVMFYYSSLLIFSETQHFLVFSALKYIYIYKKNSFLFKFEAQLFEMSKEANWLEEFFSACDN